MKEKEENADAQNHQDDENRSIYPLEVNNINNDKSVPSDEIDRQ